MKLTPEEGTRKWGERLTNAIPDVKAGIAKVKESPTAKAAAKEDKWFGGLQRAKSSGKWKRGLLAVSLEAWRDKTMNVGADRIAGGVSAAGEKMTGFYAKLFPFQEKLQAKIRAMPDTSLQDSISRMTNWVTGMVEFDKTK
jgi:hypothetical protein